MVWATLLISCSRDGANPFEFNITATRDLPETQPNPEDLRSLTLESIVQEMSDDPAITSSFRSGKIQLGEDIFYSQTCSQSDCHVSNPYTLEIDESYYQSILNGITLQIAPIQCLILYVRLIRSDGTLTSSIPLEAGICGESNQSISWFGSTSDNEVLTAIRIQSEAPIETLVAESRPIYNSNRERYLKNTPHRIELSAKGASPISLNPSNHVPGEYVISGIILEGEFTCDRCHLQLEVKSRDLQVEVDI